MIDFKIKLSKIEYRRLIECFICPWLQTIVLKGSNLEFLIAKNSYLLMHGHADLPLHELST